MRWEEGLNLTSSSFLQTCQLWRCQSGSVPAWGSEGSGGPRDTVGTAVLWSDYDSVTNESAVPFRTLPEILLVEEWWCGCQKDWGASVALRQRRLGDGWTWWHFVPGWCFQSLELISEHWPLRLWYRSHLHTAVKKLSTQKCSDIQGTCCMEKRHNNDLVHHTLLT